MKHTKVIQERQNLWNIVNKKLQQVREHIHLLREQDSWDLKALGKFRETKKRALETTNANEALEIIGYNPNGRDRIFDNIHAEMKKREKSEPMPAKTQSI